MPIYTYRCNACHAEFDQLVRSETKVACPECKGSRLERLMSLTARPTSSGRSGDKLGADLSRLGPPGGGCCGGGCHTHSH